MTNEDRWAPRHRPLTAVSPTKSLIYMGSQLAFAPTLRFALKTDLSAPSMQQGFRTNFENGR